jgi:hypothetical protein
MLQAIRELADRHRPVLMAGERTLPVIDALRPLLPGGGLRRGGTVVVSGSTAVLLAVLAGPSNAGSWCAAIGLPWLGILAAAEVGLALDRFALVPHPGRDWAAVAAALIDGFDAVAVSPPGPVRTGDARRLTARARERGTVLLAFGDAWPGADVRVRAGPTCWTGVDDGSGRADARWIAVAVEGRGAAARPRHGRLWLPADADEVWVAPTATGPLTPAHAPPAALPSAVEPPAVEPPAVEPPAVEPPAVEPPAVEPPAVEPPAVEPLARPAGSAPAVAASISSAHPRPRPWPAARSPAVALAVPLGPPVPAAARSPGPALHKNPALLGHTGSRAVLGTLFYRHSAFRCPKRWAQAAARRMPHGLLGLFCAKPPGPAPALAPGPASAPVPPGRTWRRRLAAAST